MIFRNFILFKRNKTELTLSLQELNKCVSDDLYLETVLAGIGGKDLFLEKMTFY